MCIKCRYHLAGLSEKGVCPECGSDIVLSWPRVALREFLARHAAPCPGCDKNLKGVEGRVCPFCGEVLTLRGVLTRMSRPRDWHVLSLLLLDLVIVVTGLLLVAVVLDPPFSHHRGPSEWLCVAAVMFPALIMVRMAAHKRRVRVVPLIRPPSLADYLAETDAPCPGCGYNLRGLTVEECPECALPLSVPLLHAHATNRAGVGAKDLAKGVFTTFVVCVGGIAAVALLIGAVGVLKEGWSPWYLVEGIAFVAIVVVVVRFLMRATKE